MDKLKGPKKGEKPEEKAIFDKERYDLGVKMVCEAFDKAGLTMVERFRASYILAHVSAIFLGENMADLAEKLGLKDEPIDVEPAE